MFPVTFAVDSHSGTLAVLEDLAGRSAIEVTNGAATFALDTAEARDQFIKSTWAIDHLRPISN